MKESFVFRQPILLEEESLAHVALEHHLARVLPLVEVKVPLVYKFSKE